MKYFISTIHIGRPQSFENAEGKVWTSAIAKSPVEGRVRVRFENLEGDQQADRVHHGGPDKAVLGYSSSHFPFWREQFDHWDVGSGSFGENLTIEGQTEQEVCIGDVFQVGTSQLQVSQPRQPCWKLTRRWSIPKLALHVQQTGYTGWYFRVLKEGWIETGKTLDLLERPCPDITVSWAHQVMHTKPSSRAADLRLSECSYLSESWRKQLRDRTEKASQKQREERRLSGPVSSHPKPPQ
ncbi:MAG: MOSC domain-containing protein [Deltaproteobacteria bacterium]|nr:MOSC domain-containing protein [Deltaproteobacteria bacterium]